MKKKKLTNNIGLKIASVILAVLIWLVVLNVSDPDKTITISNIPITFINENAITGQDKVYEIASGKAATVKVTGPRTIVDSLEASSFTATADLSKLSMTNAVEVDVELNTVSYRSKVELDVQTTVIISIEDLLEEEFVVEGQFKGNVPEGYVVYDRTIKNEKVMVKAPTSVMNKISKVVASVDVSGAKDDFTAISVLQAYDNRGNVIDAEENNITFDITETSVDVIIYSVKQIPLTYEIIENDYKNTVFTGIEISRKNIMVAGRKAALDNISELKLDTSALNITAEQSKYTMSFDIPALLPAGVYLYGDEKTVTITVGTDAIITKEYMAPVSEIAIKTPAEGFTAYIETKGNITYVLQGRKSILEAFVPSENMLYVSAKNLTEGQYELEVQMELGEGIIQVGTVRVTITVVAKENITQDSSTNQGNTDVVEPSESETTTTGSEDETSSQEETTEAAGGEA